MQDHQNVKEAGKSLVELRAHWLVKYANSPISEILHFIPAASVANGWLNGKATAIQIKRLTRFVEALENRLGAVESCSLTEEELHDISMQSFDAAMRARGHGKLQYMAEALSRGFKGEVLADEAETAIKLVSDLNDTEIHILLISLDHIKTSSDTGREYLPFFVNQASPTAVEDAYYLGNEFLEVTDNVLSASASTLYAKGLLIDDGAGRLGTGANQLWRPSPLAVWFVDIVASNHSGEAHN